MGAYIRTTERLVAESDAHVMVIHHLPKNGQGQPRGHSSLWGAVDTILKVTGTAQRKAIIEKQNDGEEGACFNFEVLGHQFMDPSFEGMTAGIIKETGAMAESYHQFETARDGIQLNGIANKILSLIREMNNSDANDGIIRRELYERCVSDGISKSVNPENKKRSLRRAEQTLVELGLIKRDVDGKIDLIESDKSSL